MASGKVEPENTKSQEAAAQKSDEPPKPAKDWRVWAKGFW